MKILAFAAAILTFVGCNSFVVNPYPQAKPEDAPAKYVPYETLYVQVPEGFASVVYCGTTKIATCYKSGEIMVPKVKATKAASDYKIITVSPAAQEGIDSENTVEMVVAFEDTRNGDHDYNDLVFQAKVDIKNKADGSNTAKVEITPVAHGASREIGLGVILTGENGTYSDNLLYSDVRTSLFKGDQSFINTTSASRKHYDVVNVDLSGKVNGSVTGISWYITVGGEQLFASNNFQPCLDSERKPQGLVMMNIRDDIYYFTAGDATYCCGNDFWNYPMETINIDTVYPGFDDAFQNGGDFSVFATPAAGSQYYDAIADDNLEVNSNDCLYTLYSGVGVDSGSSYTANGIQLWENGPKWADRNIGAASPEEYGLFFDWGNLEGFPCPGEVSEHVFVRDYEKTIGATLTDSFESGDIRYDAARYNLGGEWRVPTYQEGYDLVNKTIQEEVADYNGTGIPGVKFISKTDPNKFIFVPKAGIVQFTTTMARGNFGYCWNCTMSPYSAAEARTFGVTEDHGFVGGYGRNKGLTIRAICD